MEDHANHAGVEGARKAAEEYLRAQGNAAGPVEVLSAQTQVVAGTNYKLTLRAGSKKYEATVWGELYAPCLLPNGSCGVWRGGASCRHPCTCPPCAQRSSLHTAARSR